MLAGRATKMSICVDGVILPLSLVVLQSGRLKLLSASYAD